MKNVLFVLLCLASVASVAEAARPRVVRRAVTTSRKVVRKTVQYPAIRFRGVCSGGQCSR